MSLAVSSRSQNAHHQSKNKKYQIKAAKIKEITDLFDEGRIDVGDFLEAMASDENRTYFFDFLSSWCIFLWYHLSHSKKFIPNFLPIQDEVHEHYDAELDSDEEETDSEDCEDEFETEFEYSDTEWWQKSNLKTAFNVL